MRVPSLGQEDVLEKEMATHSSILAGKNPMDRGTWRATVHEVSKSQTQPSKQDYLEEEDGLPGCLVSDWTKSMELINDRTGIKAKGLRVPQQCLSYSAIFKEFFHLFS